MAYILVSTPDGIDRVCKTDAPIELTHLWCGTKGIKLKLYAEKAWLDNGEFKEIYTDIENRIINSEQMRDDVYSEVIQPASPKISEVMN